MTSATTRTLVVGGDVGYRERALTVLGEIGSVTFALTPPTDPQDVSCLVRQARADVVVLDATGCESAVADVVAALAQAAPLLGVVVICEHLTEPARRLQALPKWGWTRQLRDAVQRAHIHGSPLARPRGPLAGAHSALRASDSASAFGR